MPLSVLAYWKDVGTEASIQLNVALSALRPRCRNKGGGFTATSADGAAAPSDQPLSASHLCGALMTRIPGGVTRPSPVVRPGLTAGPGFGYEMKSVVEGSGLNINKSRQCFRTVSERKVPTER